MKFLITCYGLQGDLIMTDLRLYIKQNAKTAIVRPAMKCQLDD